jgi:hypothetical protein
MPFKDPTIRVMVEAIDNPKGECLKDTVPSKHTPGPWKVNNLDTGMNDSGAILDPVGHVIVTDVYGRDDDEAFANARLIAAAPELLKAIELVLALHDHPESQVGFRAINGDLDEVYPIKLDPMAKKQLREAVAKARGGSMSPKIPLIWPGP